MNEQSRPIFYDSSGKRYYFIYFGLLAFIITLVTVSMHVFPSILAPDTPHTNQAYGSRSEATAKTIITYATSNNIAVIGDGPFVKVVEIVKEGDYTITQDPFTHQMLGTLSSKDSLAVMNQPYAVQKFGQQNKKRIALTYDDGPDALYTPKLLDLLSRESVVATFFVVGSNVVQSDTIAKRIVREGHALGNHSFAHINFNLEDPFRSAQEIIQTGRVTRAVTGHTTKLFRTTYAGDTNQSIRNDIRSIVTSQRLGYVETLYNEDSLDWKFTDPTHTPIYPKFDSSADLVVLLHDGGGNRDKTIEYTRNLIALARSKGYTFTTVAEMANDYIAEPFAAASPSDSDMLALNVARGVAVWPKKIIIGLFVFSLTMIFLTTVINTLLAWLSHRASRRSVISKTFSPKVGVIVPAYNEGIVLEKTVQSLRKSTYKNIEIIMIDDGSTDDTWQVKQRIVAHYDSGVRAIHQSNSGKAGALNNAISQVDTDIIICLDADTIFDPQAIGHLVKHFQSPRVGAVAGVVKVGNINNYITRWQALEYTIGIMLERNAQNYVGGIMIVPGACGAWRRQAILDAGGFSHRTLAEDCDLTLAVHQLGYQVVQENGALSYTEAPYTIHALMKQRFRWTFGTFQALWVHRDIMFDSKFLMLSNFVIPMSIITILTPMLFWPLLTMITIQNIMSGNYLIILLFFTLGLAVQMIFAAIAITFGHERYRLLLALPFARFIFSPIRTYIMYRSLLAAFTGRYVGWNKLLRTGTVTTPATQSTPVAPITQTAR